MVKQISNEASSLHAARQEKINLWWAETENKNGASSREIINAQNLLFLFRWSPFKFGRIFFVFVVLGNAASNERIVDKVTQNKVRPVDLFHIGEIPPGTRRFDSVTIEDWKERFIGPWNQARDIQYVVQICIFAITATYARIVCFFHHIKARTCPRLPNSQYGRPCTFLVQQRSPCIISYWNEIFINVHKWHPFCLWAKPLATAWFGSILWTSFPRPSPSNKVIVANLGYTHSTSVRLESSVIKLACTMSAYAPGQRIHVTKPGNKLEISFNGICSSFLVSSSSPTWVLS